MRSDQVLPDRQTPYLRRRLPKVDLHLAVRICGTSRPSCAQCLRNSPLGANRNRISSHCIAQLSSSPTCGKRAGLHGLPGDQAPSQRSESLHPKTAYDAREVPFQWWEASQLDVDREGRGASPRETREAARAGLGSGSQYRLGGGMTKARAADLEAWAPRSPLGDARA